MNAYGDSEFSETGNGAIILTIPDAPTDFQENYGMRTATELAFTWNEGAQNGGAGVEDYTISYDQGTDEYVVLESNILNTAYLATALQPGTIYKFKVQARNSYGLSNYSSELSLLAAFIPEVPSKPQSSVLDD